MPHQCVRCNKFYDDGSAEILTGCSCGSRLFFYVKKEAIEKAKEITTNLTPTEKTQIEKDVLYIVGDDVEEDEAVVLDLESIRVAQPGKFEIDLVQLFNKDNPIIYKLAEGKYVVDIPQTFERHTKFPKKINKISEKKK